MIRLCVLIGIASVLAGCLDRTPKTLGAAFNERSVPIAQAKEAAAESVVAVHGTMTEKCPAAGCWFMLRDESGVIKVETKDAGFVVVDVPLRTSLTVAGRVSFEGSERILKATGVRY